MAPLKMQMDISLFSNDYIVRRMEKADVADIYLLCSKTVCITNTVRHL